MGGVSHQERDSPQTTHHGEDQEVLPALLLLKLCLLAAEAAGQKATTATAGDLSDPALHLYFRGG